MDSVHQLPTRKIVQLFDKAAMNCQFPERSIYEGTRRQAPSNSPGLTRSTSASVRRLKTLTFRSPRSVPAM